MSNNQNYISRVTQFKPINQQNEGIIEIEGKIYENLKELDSQGTQSQNLTGNLQGNLKEEIIIKKYYEIKEEEIQAIQKIRKQQSEKQSKCQNIIQIIGFKDNRMNRWLKQDPIAYVVLEKCKDNVLKLISKNKSLPYIMKLKVFAQMLQGVKELHDLGYFHRDVKPENFVYSENKNKEYKIKLIDFGFVKRTDTRFSSPLIGTLQYMAPEIIIPKNNNDFYDKTVDIWSLGITFYYILTEQEFIQAKDTSHFKQQLQKLTQGQIGDSISRSNKIEKYEQSLLSQMLQKINTQRIGLDTLIEKINSRISSYQQDNEKMDKMKRKLERQIEFEYIGKQEKLKDECRRELENEIKRKENEIKEQQEKARQYEKDIQQITEMKIQQEIQYQNDMEKFKKQKEAEYQDKIEKLKQIEQQQKEHLIQQKLKQLEEEIENKYLLEYNQKVIQLENTQSLQYQQQLEAKRQSLQNILQSQKVTINMFIDQLKEQLKILIDLNLPDSSQLQLKSQINDEVQKNQQTIVFIEQQQQEIGQSQNYEMLQEYEVKNVNDHNNLITEELNVRNKITESLLNKLKESFSTQFQMLEQEQFSPCSQDIQKINEKISFYQGEQFDFQEKNQIQDVIRLHQNISQDLQILKTKEQSIQQYEQSQQINQYQFLILKLEELQQSTNQLKKYTKEINQSIQQADINFQDKQKRLIDDLYEQLQDCQDKFKYLSKNLKYTQEIDKIFNQTEYTFSQINYLSKLLNLGIFQNYFEFNQTLDQITKQFQSFEKQYNYLLSQIYNNQQIELRNLERIKILETTKQELNYFIERLSNLKQQFNNLIYNQGGINEQIKNQIKEKSQYIDQTISEYNKQFQIFQYFNQLDSCENINKQIKEMESFQQKLKQQIVEETEKLSKLQFLIQTSYIDKSLQEKELFKLNNQLQSQFIQFSKALQSIKIACVSNEFLTKMLAKTSQLEQILKEQKNTLQQNFDISKENQILVKEKIIEIDNQKDFFKGETQRRLVKLQQNSLRAGEELEGLFNNVNQKCKQIQFQNMNNEIIQNYEYLQKQDKELSGEITSINDKIFNQQLTLQELNQLKDNVQQLIQKLNDLNMKIPQNNKIQEFNNVFKINLESYEIIYALVNYVKQFHITRYYERIKEHANKQRGRQQNQSQYVKQFNKKQEQELEVNTQKEKKAQELLQRYYNILFNNASKMMIEAMENDQQQMDKIIIEQENQIKLTFNVKLKGFLRQQLMIKDIIDQQYYKVKQYSQMLIFKSMSIANHQDKFINIY